MEASRVLLDLEALNDKDVQNKLLDLPDELLPFVTFSFPWQVGGSMQVPTMDADGFSIQQGKKEENYNREQLQKECWQKSITNPIINTNVRGLAGRLNGYGFSVTSDIQQIQDVIDEIELDPRNRLYSMYNKYTVRSIIEGELFHILTCHDDGFIEIDFVDPSVVTGVGADGIIFHPGKPCFPLFYCVDFGTSVLAAYRGRQLIPSIYMARYPDLIDVARITQFFSDSLTVQSQKKGRKFRELGGFYRFMIAWDKGYLTNRNISHVRTTLKWLNYYENLKEYEIDHKKSAGAYLWVLSITDPKAFKMWLSMSDTDRNKTGIAAPKVPGSTLVLPPGMTLDAKNPQLPKITDTDTDILSMISSGLNEPSDVTMGTSQSPFASVKASRGPMSDRISDEAWYYENYLRYDFWGSVFFLKSKLTGFPATFKVRQALSFKPAKESDPESAKPIFGTVTKRPEQMIEITFPVSEVVDAEARARAYLGVKHGSTNDTLGIPNSEIAKKLGFGNYKKLRLTHATEEYSFPPLIPTVDAETQQERTVAEPSPAKIKRPNQPQGGKTDGKETPTNK